MTKLIYECKNYKECKEQGIVPDIYFGLDAQVHMMTEQKLLNH